MDAGIVTRICEQVYRKFPEVNGAAPRISQQKGGDVSNYLLVFRGSARTVDGKSIPRIVRVVATLDGRVLKMTTSR